MCSPHAENQTNLNESVSRKRIDRSVVYGESINMTDKSLIAKQSSSIELKTIVSTVDCGKRAEPDDKDNLQHQCNQGINIKFQNLIYRVRQNIIWDRCKLKKISSFNTNENIKFMQFIANQKHLFGM